MSLSSMFILLIFSVLHIFSVVPGNAATDAIHHKYCVIGAGPAGLQMGYFLHQNKRDYIVFEKGSGPGTFFETYPRHDKLISINKRHTGQQNKEFNLRHDWNSLLSHDESLLFTRYSKLFFPMRKELLHYLKDYQKKLKIKTQFDTTISKISKENKKFTMLDQHGQQYSCDILLVASGLSTPNIPKFSGVEHTVGYEDMSLNPEDYEGKTVLILGKGNTAFEVAASIYGNTALIHMFSRNRLRLAWSTHYVGDLRAVNNELLDTYQLKSLDGLVFESEEQFHFVPYGKKYQMVFGQNVTEENVKNSRGGDFVPYDVIIRCMGFQFDDSLFNRDSLNISRGQLQKYPLIDSDFQSTDATNLYFAGTIGHSLDWRKAAGGFIHGFRYNVRALSKLLEWRYESVQWPHMTHHVMHLVDHLIRRINEASGPYQMYSFLGDIAILSKNKTSYTFIEEYPVMDLPRLAENTGLSVDGGVIVWVFEYGKNFSQPAGDVFRSDRAHADITTAHESNFLHPVFYYFEHLPTQQDMESLGPKDTLPRPDRLLHIIENFLTFFRKREAHVLPLQRFVETVVGHDLGHYSAESCLTFGLTTSSLPLGCSFGGPVISGNFRKVEL